MIAEEIELSGWTPSEAVVAAEMAVTGAVIQSRRALDEASELLDPADFYSSAGAVFTAALSLRGEGKPVEPAAVLGELRVRGDLERVGGGLYLAKLVEHAALGGSLGYYVRTIAADSGRRRLHIALRRGMQRTGGQAWDPELDIDLVRKEIDEALVRRIGERPRDVSEGMIALLNDLENPPKQIPGVVPPFKDLAGLITAFRPGQLIVIAGRPGMGKSVLAADIARQAAIRDGHTTIVFSIEMSERELLERITSAESKVPLHVIRRYDISASDLERVARVAGSISGAPLVIDNANGCTLEHIRSQLRWLSRTGPIGLVIIDYIQIMKAPKSPRRDQEIATITRELKEIAGEYGVPVIALSQLNRESEKRNDKRPQASDLRESGAIEADADIIILVHREDAYEPESPRAGEADLIVEKNRNGPRATITVASQLHFSKFSDMAGDYPPTPPPSARPDSSGRPNLTVVH